MIPNNLGCRVVLFAGVVSGVLLASPVMAQRAASPMVVRVHVADSTGAPISGADVSVVRGLSTILSHGQTDVRGDKTFSVGRSGGDDQIVVRMIGYQRVSRFFADSAASAAFTIVLARSVRALDTVRVAEREDVRRKSYFIDAEAIENSPRPVFDALDVVTKLRPDMIWGRSGKPDGIDQHVTRTRIDASGLAHVGGAAAIRSPRQVIANGAKYGYCGPVADVWVNGKRIFDVLAYNAVATLRLNGDGRYIRSYIATILASIKPEHVAEMEYHPCTDAGEKPYESNAIMVQLKDGIGFDPGNGSYVLSSGIPAAPTTGLAGSAFPRLLGVFDDETGEPLVDVEVVDVATGTLARTTSTGTVTLSFVPAGAAQLKIQRAGFVPQIIPVSMSPTDTMPVTIILAHAKSP